MASSLLVKRIPIIVILGATGAGKSKLAIDLALRYNGEIISTDAMQVYKGLDIVTNKVTPEEQKIVTHHLIDYICPHTSNFNVVDFKNDALPKIQSILSKNKLPVLVGGTNYYIEALLWNLLIENSTKKTSSSTGQTENVNGSSPNKSKLGNPLNELKKVCKEKKSDGEVTLNIDKGEKREAYKEPSTRDLYNRLKEVDLASAKRIHPHDRRKVIRALEIYDEHNTPMSEILDLQHSEEGACDIAGPMRYPDPCVIWVQCQQDILDDRINKRVDKMMEQGLVAELEDFHQNYNKQRLGEQGEADYSKGIFQSIGFKEFHQYLLLSPEERLTENGQELFQQGIEDMKMVTRRYSRKQKKWIVGRFLRRRGTNIPLVYGVDSSDIEQWQNQVHQPACEIVQAYLNNDSPCQETLVHEESDNEKQYNVCDECGGMVFVTLNNWKAHITGRRHRKNLAYNKRKREEISKNDDSKVHSKESKLKDTLVAAEHSSN